MSNYYEYADVKRKMVHRLFKLGWKVYGWCPDNSDPMTDYYDPEFWSGIAEKNGYVLVVDWAQEVKEDKYRTTKTTVSLDAKAIAKIQKLEKMTQENGASEQEEASAKKSIEALKNKANGGDATEEKQELVSRKHLANPKGSNWHVEKDGVIVEKGTGLLKFYRVMDITDDRDAKEWQDFNNKTETGWKEDYVREYRCYWNSTIEEAKKQADYRYKDMKEQVALLEKFNALMNKIDSAAGSMVGNSEYEYQKVVETVYKTEKKAVKAENGEIKEGQCYRVKGYFTSGIRKGDVYRIHRTEYKGSVSYHAQKLNGKLTKECTGQANPSNYWWVDAKRFEKWIEKDALEWVTIEDVQVGYEVEKIKKVKVAKDTRKTEGTKNTEKTENTTKQYEIKEGTREGAHEIYFGTKPENDVLTKLKEIGMRWNNKKQCWYGFVSVDEIQEAVA